MLNLSYVDIARLEERRQAIGTAEIALHAEPIAGGWMAFGGLDSWANQACGLGLDGPVSDEELDRLVSFYVTRGVEPKIEVCPFAHESLIRGLAARSFSLRDFESVMIREIGASEDLWATLPNGLPEGLELSRVDPEDEARVALFVEVSSSGFLPEGQPVPKVLFDITRRMVQHPRCDAYLAYVGGEPAGGGAMEVGEGVGCLFGTSVLPRFRRRGVQQALIVQRLERARERGCLLMAIHSRPGIPTERNAARVGFTMAYTKVAMAMRGDGLAPSP